MSKKEFTKGLVIGFIAGALITFGVLWYWDANIRKSKFERNVEKIQKDAKKELDKAKKIFN